MYYADSSDGWKAELPDTDGCRVALDEPFDYSTTPVPPHCEAGGKGIETKPIGDHGFQEVFATATWAGYNGKQKLECYRANDEDSFDGCTTYGYCWARKVGFSLLPIQRLGGGTDRLWHLRSVRRRVGSHLCASELAAKPILASR